MLKGLVRRVGLTCLAAVLAFGAQAQGAATISLKAVAKNGVAIAPTNSLSIAPNDTITAEVFISGWNNPPFDGGTALLATYQASLLGEQGVLSNSPDTNTNAIHVLPVGWDAPIVKDSCPCDNPAYPVCNTSYGCVGNSFNATTMASLNTTRRDWIFLFFDSITAFSVATLNIRWGATINGSDGQTASRCVVVGTNGGESCTSNAQCSTGTCSQTFQSYAGTLNLKAGANVCGTTTFTFSNDQVNTFIANPAAIPVTVLPAIQGLTLTVPSGPNQFCPQVPGACCNETAGTCQNNITQANCTGRWGGPNSTCATLDPPCVALGACCIEETATCTNGVPQANCSGRWGGGGSTCGTLNPPCQSINPITAVSPPNCAIDARQPFPPSQAAQRQGFNSWTLTFQNPRTSGEDAANDFTIRQVPSTTPPIPPTISSVTPVGANGLTLNLSAPIQPNKWTCVKHNASNVEKCLGFLPADANSNRAALPNDILTIIDNLNNIIPDLQLYQCDIDRSGSCLAADILREIDLLNGVTGYPVQNGKTLEVCPAP